MISSLLSPWLYLLLCNASVSKFCKLSVVLEQTGIAGTGAMLRVEVARLGGRGPENKASSPLAPE